MAKLKEIDITQLADFIAEVESASVTPSHSLWYRGVGRSSHFLLPSLYRHPTLTTPAEMLDLEEKILVRFRERSVPYRDFPISDPWEYLFLMQHFGVPTRLLDWTENPFVALFFALIFAAYDKSTGNYVEDATVWILDPAFWNKTVFAHISFSGAALSTSDRPLLPYRPKPDNPDPVPAHPAALYGIHNSPRIVAQRGVFTIFGSSMEPLEQIYENNSFPAATLKKLIIKKGSIAALKERLFTLGFTDSVIFPDLEGLARETKRTFGFEV